MNTFFKRALRTTLVTSGLLLAGTAAAQAADTDGVANGTDITAPITVDVDLSGLALGVLGDANSTSVAPAEAAAPPRLRPPHPQLPRLPHRARSTASSTTPPSSHRSTLTSTSPGSRSESWGTRTAPRSLHRRRHRHLRRHPHLRRHRLLRPSLRRARRTASSTPPRSRHPSISTSTSPASRSA